MTNTRPPSGPAEAAQILGAIGFNVITFDEDTVFCPLCEWPSSPMGTLGSKLYYRCRACGATFTGADWEPEN